MTATNFTSRKTVTFATSQFALIIGVDKYVSDAIQNLRGAVADTQAVAAYLRQRGVPQDHITILENKTATRAAILGGLRRLAQDPRIQHGDFTVIFYAGHGSQAAAPLGWEAGGENANIQLTLPCDMYCSSGDQVVPPIPDRTLGALLESLSQKKGNNIVVIMDICYSASRTRRFSDSSDMVRSAPPPPNFQLPESLDQDIWSFLPDHGGLRSHVLLSASSSSGLAWESNGRGVFTVTLLELLERSRIDKLRYCDIPMRMDIHSKQAPHCEGFNRDRYIFTTTSSSTEYFIPVYTRISNNGRIAYLLNGGAAHGLSIGDEFAVYLDMDSLDSELGILVVDEVDHVSTWTLWHSSQYTFCRHPYQSRMVQASPPILLSPR